MNTDALKSTCALLAVIGAGTVAYHELDLRPDRDKQDAIYIESVISRANRLCKIERSLRERGEELSEQDQSTKLRMLTAYHQHTGQPWPGPCLNQ